MQTNVATTEHLKAAGCLRAHLARYREVEDLIRLGAYAPGADREVDQSVRLYPALESFLRQEKNETCEFDETIRRLTGLFAGGAPCETTTRPRMMGQTGDDDRRLDAIQALLRVRDLELRQVEGALQKQQRKVFELQSDVLRLGERCQRLRPTDSRNVIERRRALDALIRAKLERRAELECAKKEVTDLLPVLHGAQGRRDAVFRLWSRRRLDRAITSQRRQEAAAADLAATKRVQRRAEAGHG